MPLAGFGVFQAPSAEDYERSAYAALQTGYRLIDTAGPSYNRRMPEFKYFHPIEVRYADLDPQGHVNNAKHLTYFEQARVQYFVHLGLFGPDQSFQELSVIIADIHIHYHAPIFWGTPLQVGVRISKITSRALTVEQAVADRSGGKLFASGTVILVTYSYLDHTTTAVPGAWREKIAAFEEWERPGAK